MKFNTVVPILLISSYSDILAMFYGLKSMSGTIKTIGSSIQAFTLPLSLGQSTGKLWQSLGADRKQVSRAVSHVDLYTEEWEMFVLTPSGGNFKSALACSHGFSDSSRPGTRKRIIFSGLVQFLDGTVHEFNHFNIEPLGDQKLRAKAVEREIAFRLKHNANAFFNQWFGEFKISDLLSAVAYGKEQHSGLDIKGLRARFVQNTLDKSKLHEFVSRFGTNVVAYRDMANNIIKMPGCFWMMGSSDQKRNICQLSLIENWDVTNAISQHRDARKKGQEFTSIWKQGQSLAAHLSDIGYNAVSFDSNNLAWEIADNLFTDFFLSLENQLTCAFDSFKASLDQEIYNELVSFGMAPLGLAYNWIANTSNNKVRIRRFQAIQSFPVLFDALFASSSKNYSFSDYAQEQAYTLMPIEHGDLGLQSLPVYRKLVFRKINHLLPISLYEGSQSTLGELTWKQLCDAVDGEEKLLQFFVNTLKISPYLIRALNNIRTNVALHSHQLIQNYPTLQIMGDLSRDAFPSDINWASFYKTVMACSNLSRVDYLGFHAFSSTQQIFQSSRNWVWLDAQFDPEKIPNVKDFVRAFAKQILAPLAFDIIGEKSPFLPHSNLAYLMQHASTASEGGPSMIEQALTLRVGLKHLVEMSEYWHQHHSRISGNLLKGDVNLCWPALFPAQTIDGVLVLPLTNAGELKEEGEQLNHCVGTYTGQAMWGSSHIISLRTDQARLSTLEIVLEDKNGSVFINLKQNQGQRNSDPSDLAHGVANKLIDLLCDGTIPVDIEYLLEEREKRNREKSSTQLINEVGYDFTSLQARDRALQAWRFCLPAGARDLGWQEWAKKLNAGENHRLKDSALEQQVHKNDLSDNSLESGMAP